MENILVLVRHGQSEWNKDNLFTGWRDPDLTALGIIEARNAGRLLKARGMEFDIAYTSLLVRAQHTLALILEELGQLDLKPICHQALNERDYGALSGLNKDEARERWGEEQVRDWRRSYDVAPPQGESLKDTAARVLPYFDSQILSDVKKGKRIIVSAHGNSIRALIMHLEGMSPAEISQCEVATGVPIIYNLNEQGLAACRTDLVA